MISLLLLLLAGEKRNNMEILSGLLELFKPQQTEGLISGKTFSPDPFINKVIEAESSGNPKAVSPVGAKGLMQIMDATAEQPGFGIKPLEDPFDPVENVRFGTEYLYALMDRYNDDTTSALAAYNWGVGNVDKWLKKGGDFNELPKETQNYIKKITE